MFYYLYQITNNLNGKIYVGVHKTNDLDDGYMGSGKVIRSAIIKHGIENFTKVILEQFENAAAMYAREKEVVTDEFLLREDTYNLRRGGFGGFDHINRTMTKKDRQSRGSHGGLKGGKISGDSAYRNKTGIHSDEIFKKTRGMKSAEHLDQMLQSAREVNKGTIFINNGMQNKRLKSYLPIPEGWVKGRKPNNLGKALR